MKTFVAFIALALTFSLHARSLHPDTYLQVAEITEMNIDIDDSLREMDIVNGHVHLNTVTRKVSLRFYLAWSCPVGRVCTMVMPTHRIELPLVESKTDSCGVVTYKGRRNMLPADGVDETLIIKDTSKATCELYYPAATLVTYKKRVYDRPHARLKETVSTFLATELGKL